MLINVWNVKRLVNFVKNILGFITLKYYNSIIKNNNEIIKWPDNKNCII